MNTAVLFAHASDDWETPDSVFQPLCDEFHLTLDAAASAANTKLPDYLTQEDNALTQSWAGQRVWCNPPYSRCRDFVAKAATEARVGTGTLVVLLLPARTDTRWFHAHLWDTALHRPRPGVTLRFLKGRLKFSGAPNSAPFPSLVAILYGTQPV